MSGRGGPACPLWIRTAGRHTQVCPYVTAHARINRKGDSHFSEKVTVPFSLLALVFTVRPILSTEFLTALWGQSSIGDQQPLASKGVS